MLSKSVVPGVSEWDEKLPYVLFAYRSTVQPSTGESPFYLLYGRDPQLPTETILCPPAPREPVVLDDYKSFMMREMSNAWETAQKSVQKAQKKQKRQHDKAAKDVDIQVGERVFVYMPALKSGPAHKLARPFQGPYRVVETYPNGVAVIPVEKPRAASIRVALNRVRRCPEQIRREANPPTADLMSAERDDTEAQVPDPGGRPSPQPSAPVATTTERRGDAASWRGRLRPRTTSTGTS